MKKGIYILAALALFLVFSCKKKKEPITKPDLGEAYYPTTIGKYVVYDVDSIVFAEIGYAATSYKYQIKEKIEEEYTDMQGRPALKLVRYIKKFDSIVSYSAMPWTIKDVWQVNVSAKNVEVVEENVRFVKLIFPVKKSVEWNGNSMNTLGEWAYTYTSVDNAETINSNNFENVLCVTQKNFPTFISREYYIEKYAKDVGLVYREIIDVKLATVTGTNVPVLSIPDKSGIVYKLTVVNYGYE